MHFAQIIAELLATLSHDWETLTSQFHQNLPNQWKLRNSKKSAAGEGFSGQDGVSSAKVPRAAPGPALQP